MAGRVNAALIQRQDSFIGTNKIKLILQFCINYVAWKAFNQ